MKKSFILPVWLALLILWVPIIKAQTVTEPQAPSSSQTAGSSTPSLDQVEKSATEQLSTCITAIAAQSDPAKLATLGERAANPRLKRIMYWLAAARPENRQRMRRGGAPIVTRGPYAGENAEVDHIVPLARADEIGNKLANLEMLPATLNRAKGAKVGERQLDLAKKFHAAGLISDATMENIQGRFKPSSTALFVQSPDLDETPTPVPTIPPAQTVDVTSTVTIPPVPSPTPAVVGPRAPPVEAEMVWVNTASHIYHRPHSHWYGKTREGKFVTEEDALAEGDRAAKHNE